MNKLHLSEEVQNDLLEIKTYIEEELLNPSAALATVSKITKVPVFCRTTLRPELCYLRLQI